ncbi:hypothetical protein Q3G72_031229 [Acer saccharum]|nr:hypothetical protein Q3G72_031229 [Acer saccharum]
MDSPYNANGDNEAPYINSSEDETGVDRMYGYNLRNEWKPDPNGQISLQVGQVFESAEKGREILRRPKKSRRRKVDEGRPRKRSSTVRCTNCEQYGHNRSTCTNPRNPSMESEKRRNGQPRRRIKVRSETGAGIVQGSQGGTFVHSNLTDIGSQIGSTSQM